MQTEEQIRQKIEAEQREARRAHMKALGKIMTPKKRKACIRNAKLATAARKAKRLGKKK